MATDPHGWMQPGAQPGSVIVKIQNTSRSEVNGKFAACLIWQEDRGRYVVHLTDSQQQLSLKPENLVKASMMEQMQAQYQLFQNHPEIKRKITEYYQLISEKTGTKPEYVAGGALVALLVAMYLVGFSKIMLLISFLMMVGVVAAPDLSSPPQVILRNFPGRFRTMIRQQVPVVGPRIADNYYLSMAVMGLVLVFFVNALFFSSGRSTASAAMSDYATTSSQPNLGGGAIVDQTMLNEYYKKGFEDGQAGLDFGTSMPEPQPSSVYVEPEPSIDYDYIPPPSRPSMFSKLFDFSTAMSIMYLGRTLYSMGTTPDGGWDYQLAMANLQNMDAMRMGFLGFSVYRLVSKFL